MLEGIIGIVAGILTAISMLPQLIKMIREKNGDELSLATLIVLISGLSLWVCYGVIRKDWPIIITNSFSVLVNIVLVSLKLYYRKKA